jgi:hypothetical protein
MYVAAISLFDANAILDEGIDDEPPFVYIYKKRKHKHVKTIQD